MPTLRQNWWMWSCEGLVEILVVADVGHKGLVKFAVFPLPPWETSQGSSLIWESPYPFHPGLPGESFRNCHTRPGGMKRIMEGVPLYDSLHDDDQVLNVMLADSQGSGLILFNLHNFSWMSIYIDFSGVFIFVNYFNLKHRLAVFFF